MSRSNLMQQIEPYKVTNVTLLTYSGKTVKVTLESEIFTEPIRRVKDRILDAFTSMCKDSKDPFVRIKDISIKPIFKKLCC